MSQPQTDMSQPQMTSPYGQGPMPSQGWGPPYAGQQPVPAPQAAMSPRTISMIILIGNVLVAVGIIVLAFSLMTVTVYPATYSASGSYSFGIGVIVLTAGALLAGVGYLIRSFGLYLTATR